MICNSIEFGALFNTTFSIVLFKNILLGIVQLGNWEHLALDQTDLLQLLQHRFKPDSC